MPASDWLVGYGGLLDLTTLIETALTGASLTTAPPGSTVIPVTFSINHFRVPRAARGNVIAHARVVNSSSLFVFTEVRVQDPDGRPLAQGSSQAAIVPVTPPPPPAPASLQRVEEPIYATPDPYLRPVTATAGLQQALAGGASGLEVVRCALAACDAVRPLGLEIRAGVHTGEVELHDRDLARLAVHIAARLEGQASAGEVVKSSPAPSSISRPGRGSPSRTAASAS